MITTRRTHPPSRTPAGLAIAIAAAVALVVLPVSAAPTTAREALPSTSKSSSAGDLWYATPLALLGGHTLAQYVADHESRVLAAVRG